jgi:non-specific serine/threonine protein kinase
MRPTAIDPAEALPAAADAPPPEGCLFRPEGDYWTIVYGGRVARLRDSVGLRHLARLLWNPHREFPAIDLMRDLAASGAGRRTPPERADLPAVDLGAAAACLQRVRDLLESLARSGGRTDRAQADALRRQLDLVARDLRHLVRRRGAGMDEERARVAVAKTLRATLCRIRQTHGTLADHLETALRRGYACSYRPDPRFPIRWER